MSHNNTHNPSLWDTLAQRQDHILKLTGAMIMTAQQFQSTQQF
jgi:hypothetical protein